MTMDEPLDLTMLDDIELGTFVGTEAEAADARVKKREAIETLEHYGVYEDVTEEEANEMGLKFIRARWEHQQRAGADSKWRYVAQEFAWQEQRDDCFAASSTGQTARTIDFLALKEGWATFGADCVKAYYQAKQKENVCVRPPAEYIEMLAQAGRRTDVVWKLHRMLPGQRIAGAGWVDDASERLKNEGFDRCEALPQFFRRASDGIVIEMHMDDFHGCGESQAAKQCVERLREVFDLKATEVFMTGRYSHLRRDRLREGNVTFLRGNPVHVDKLIELYGMEKAKITGVPSLPDRMPDRLGEPEPLDTEETKMYRRGVGILLYLAADRWDIKRDVEVCARSLKEPTTHDRRRIIKIVRYLKGTRCFGHKLEINKDALKGKVALDLFSDTNYAPDDGTRRAMTCGQVYLDGMAYHCLARRQGVQSTSSGEAEFYGSTSVVMDGKVIWHLMEWLGYEVTATLFVDSAAAKGMLLRDGVGAVKHLDVRSLWVQQERHNGLKIKKVAGTVNPADLCTKDHPQKKFEELRSQCGMADCKMIDGYEEHNAMAIEYECRGGNARRASTRARWASGALQLLMAAAAIAESAGSELVTLDKTDHYEYEYQCKDDRGSDPPVRVVEGIIIMLLLMIVVLQWRLMAAWSREKEIAEHRDYISAAADIIVRSKASQSQVTYTRKHQTPRFVPLNENLQG